MVEGAPDGVAQHALPDVVRHFERELLQHHAPHRPHRAPQHRVRLGLGGGPGRGAGAVERRARGVVGVLGVFGALLVRDLDQGTVTGAGMAENLAGHQKRPGIIIVVINFIATPPHTHTHTHTLQI